MDNSNFSITTPAEKESIKVLSSLCSDPTPNDWNATVPDLIETEPEPPAYSKYQQDQPEQEEEEASPFKFLLLASEHDRQQLQLHSSRITKRKVVRKIIKHMLVQCQRRNCTTRALPSGVCKLHEKTQCKFEGCNKRMQVKGFCRAHGERPLCAVAQCFNRVVARGFCGKHCGYDRAYGNNSGSKRKRTKAATK